MTTTPNTSIITGDFNTWALEWGIKTTNQRGSALFKVFALLDAVLLNTGAQNTFERSLCGSTIDISFGSRTLFRTTTVLKNFVTK